MLLPSPGADHRWDGDHGCRGPVPADTQLPRRRGAVLRTARASSRCCGIIRTRSSTYRGRGCTRRRMPCLVSVRRTGYPISMAHPPRAVQGNRSPRMHDLSTRPCSRTPSPALHSFAHDPITQLRPPAHDVPMTGAGRWGDCRARAEQPWRRRWESVTPRSISHGMPDPKSSRRQTLNIKR